MPDTLAPARFDETLIRGDTYTGTWLVEEGTTASTAVPVSIAGRSYTMTFTDPTTGNVLASISSGVVTASGAIYTDYLGVTGQLHWRLDQSVTVTFPQSVVRTLVETNSGDVQTLFWGLL